MATPATSNSDGHQPASASVIHVAPPASGALIIESSDLLFKGRFSRSGSDLVLTGGDGQKVVVGGYFATPLPADLMSGEGGLLTGGLVVKLAGPRFPSQYAQAASVPGATPIGQIESGSGVSTARRADGTTVTLQVGTAVFEGDVIETGTGASLNITFADRTVLTLDANAQMVLDQFVYNPGGSGNSSLFNLVQGTFVFVAGQIAPTGEMKIETPVASMGIRGTSGVIEVAANNGVTAYTLIPDPGGTLGSFSVFNKQTGALLFSANQANQSLTVQSAAGDYQQAIRLPDQLLTQSQVIGFAFATYNAVQTRIGSGQPAISPSNTGTPAVPGQPGQPIVPQQPGAPATPDGQQQQQQAPGKQGAAPGGDAINTAGIGDGTGLGNAGGIGAPGATTGEGIGLLGNLSGGVGQGGLGGTPTASTSNLPLGPPAPVAPTLVVPAVSPTVNEDGSITITGFAVTDSDSGIVTVTINAQSTVTLASTAGLTFLQGNGTDFLVFSGSPAAVTAALNGLTYAPTPDDNGTGGLTITVNDGHAIVAATVVVNITPVPDAPVAVADGPYATSEEASVSVTAGNGVLVGATDADGDALTAQVVTTTAHGTLVLNPNGSFSYTPSADFNGSDTFIYRASDGLLTSANVTVTIDVAAVNDAPVVPPFTDSVALAAVYEDTSPAGQTVAALVAASFSDAADDVVGGSHADALAGVAIWSAPADAAAGVWQHSPDGIVWTTVPDDVSSTSAIVVAADGLIRFLPNPDYYGFAPTLDVYLIDASAGAVETGTIVDLDATGIGGTTPYSSDSVGLHQEILAVNDAPVLAINSSPSAELPIARVSVDAGGLEMLADSYGRAAFSPDGTKIVFAANHFTFGENTNVDIFVKDLASGELTLVSADAGGVPGNGPSTTPVFSPDGTKLMFASSAYNLLPGDSFDGAHHIYIKDLATGAIERVVAGNSSSSVPVFSPDGTHIAFRSDATDLIPGDTNVNNDVFVMDLATGAVTRVSTDASGGEGIDDSFNPGASSGVGVVFSPDGTKVAFDSLASNLVPGDTNFFVDVFVKDLSSGAITRVSTDANGVQGNGPSYDIIFSPDGGKVAFTSGSTNLVEGHVGVFIKDLTTDAVTAVQGSQPAFSPDGAKIATTFFDGSNYKIIVTDVLTGTSNVVSTGANGIEANSTSVYPVFSPDGTQVAFASAATNLVPGDTNGGFDIFVKTIDGNSYVENQSPVAIAPALAISDVDSPTLASATVSITGGFHGGEDVLAFVNDGSTMGDVAGSYDNGVLTLTSQGGTATLAQWQSALHAVTYFNASDSPSPETRTISFQVDDGQVANHASNVVTTTVAVMPVNDPPQITSEPGVGSVTEDGPGIATGAMTWIDVDDNPDAFWTVVGGSPVGPADYTFALDTFKIMKGAEFVLFEDHFSDGVPPPNANGNPTAYGVLGTFTEPSGSEINDGVVLFDSADSAPSASIGTSDPFIANALTYRSNIDPTNANDGLKITQDFTVEGRFDLVTPDSPREAYGIRLSDRLVNGPGNPPDQAGDDIVELVVRMGQDGVVRVQLRHVDFVLDEVENLAGTPLAAPDGANQIVLRLEHVANTGEVHASFDLVNTNSEVSLLDSQSFAAVGHIFGTGTPEYSGDDESWTRAQAVAYAPEIQDSTLSGAYGTLTIGQSGAWTYVLDNSRPAVQALAANQPATDTFTVQVTDEHGESDTQTIDIAITGTNDAPVLDAGGSLLAYVENQPPTAIDPALAVTDVDSATLAGATVAITGNFQAGEDVLGFTDQSGITGSYNAETGVLALSGTASVADYQTALQSVTYANTSESPSGAERTISYQVDDGQPADHASNAATATVTVTPVNDAPTTTPVDLSHLYTLDFWISLNTASTPNSFSVSWGGQTLMSLSNSAAFGFTEYTFSGLSATGTSTPLTFNFGTVQNFSQFYYLDDVSVTASSNPGTNIVINGDFESGNTGWTTHPAYFWPGGPGHDSAHASYGFLHSDTVAQNVSTVVTEAFLEDSGAKLITQAMLLANASDVDNTNAQLSATGLAISSGLGMLVDNLNGTWSYTPALNDDTSVSFSYTVSDGALTAAGSATLDIVPVNDAPTATNLSAAETYTEDTALNLTDIVVTDVDSVTVTATLTLSNIAAGSLSTATSGAVTSTYAAGTGVWTASGATASVNALLAGVTFTPASNFNGNFTIATSISDGIAPAITGSKSFTGTPVNDAPFAAGGGIGVFEDTPATNAYNFSDGDADDAASTLVQTIVAQPAQGIVTAIGGGQFTFDPNGQFEDLGAGDERAVTFTYHVTDPHGATSADNTFLVTVHGVEDPVLIMADTVSAAEDTATAGLGAALIANDDPDGGSTITIASIGNATNGSVALDGGNPVFTPAANFSGQAGFDYWITDAASPPAPGTFGAQATYAAGVFPQGVSVGDLNEDGKLDLVTSNYTANALSVLLGNGNGTFQSPTTVATGPNPAGVVQIVDFNADGNLDLAVAAFGNDTVAVHLGNGNGTFQSAVSYAAGDGPEWLLSGDVNSDGKTDLVVSNFNAGSVSVLLGNGNGTFQSPLNQTTGAFTYGTALGDFNLDGNVDIAVANAGANTVSILIGNGNGTFQNAVNLGTGASPNAVATGDLNADGYLDLAVSNGNSSTVSILLGNGDGTFQAQTTFAAGSFVKTVSIADLNQDGYLDLAVANSRDPAISPAVFQANSVSILLGNGDGTFQAPTQLTAGWDTYGVAIADLNGDGRLDLAAPNEIGGNVSVFLNTSPGGTLSTAHVTVDVAPVAERPSLAQDLAPHALGDEFRVNNVTANAQNQAAIAPLAGGGYVIAFTSNGQDGAGDGIVAQRFDAAGGEVGPELVVNTATTGDQTEASVAALADGGFLVAWADYASGGAEVRARRYDADGNADGGDFQVNTYTDNYQHVVNVAGLAFGGFVVSWVSDLQDTSGYGIYARQYDAAGTAGSEFRVNNSTASDQTSPSIAALSDGGYVVAWTSLNQDGDGYGIYARQFNSAGAPGSEIPVNTTTAGDQLHPSVAGLTSGGYVVTWNSPDASGGGLYGQVFDFTGAKVGLQFAVNQTTAGSQTQSSVASVPDGGFLAVWTSDGQDGSSNGLYGQRFGSTGTPIGSEFLVNQTTAGDQSGAYLPDSVAVLTSGVLVVTWQGDPSVSGSEVYARHLSIPGYGGEDTVIGLPAITAALGADLDGSETLALVLSGFPAGTTFSKGALAATGPEAGNWVISNATDIDSLAGTPLTMTPPADFAGEATFTVRAVATDTALLTTGTETSSTFAQTQITVTVIGANDAPVIANVPSIFADENATTFALGLAVPTDADNDPLTITVTGVPTNGEVILADGSAVTNGQQLTSSQLSGLLFAPSAVTADTTSSFSFTVSDGTASTGSSVPITVLDSQQAVLMDPANNDGSFESYSGVGHTLSPTTLAPVWTIASVGSGGLLTNPPHNVVLAGADGVDALFADGPAPSSTTATSFDLLGGAYTAVQEGDVFTWSFDVNSWSVNSTGELKLNFGGGDVTVGTGSAGDSDPATFQTVSGMYAATAADAAGGQLTAAFTISTSTDPGSVNVYGDDVQISVVPVQTLNGTVGQDVLVGSAGSDILDGGSGADKLFGLAGNDLMITNNIDFVSIDGGTGQDALRLTDTGGLVTYNLTGLDIAGIEAIEIDNAAGASAMTLSVGYNDVVNLSAEANTDLVAAADGVSLLDGADYNALDNTVISVNAGNTAATLDLQPGGSGAWQPAASPQVTIGADSFTLYNYVDGASILATVAVQAEVTVVGGGGVIYG